MESEDKNGRTSLRQIIATDSQGRPSLLNKLSDRDANPSSAGSGQALRFVRKSELSQDLFSNRSVISIKGEKEVSIKYGASEKMAAQLVAQINFSYTVPPQSKPIMDLHHQQDSLNMSLKESMTTGKNPMISPNTNTAGGYGDGQKRHMTEQDPFQMSESASIVQGSDKGHNLLSSHLDSSYPASQNLSSLIWQLPYGERKSILHHQAKAVEAATAMNQSEDLGTEEIAEEDAFATAEDTDLNEEELDLNVSRKMSIRGINVTTMHRFSPGSITGGAQRLSYVGLNNAGGGSDFMQQSAFPPKP